MAAAIPAVGNRSGSRDGLPASIEYGRSESPCELFRTSRNGKLGPSPARNVNRRAVLLNCQLETIVSESRAAKRLSLPVQVCLLCAGLLCSSVFAEDACDHKFETLKTGSTLNEILLVVGKPDLDERVIVLGVEKRRLEWACGGVVYRALLIGSRMVAKSSSRKSGFFSF